VVPFGSGDERNELSLVFSLFERDEPLTANGLLGNGKKRKL
jgi:hypothetical protein